MLSKLLRIGEGRMVKRLQKVADYVNTLSDDMEKLSDDELRAKTAEFKQRVADGADLDDLLPEAFAVAREAAWRVLGQKHFEVQIMGGAALHYGNVAEMKTGEGKTLTAVLPAYLNALSGKGVHVVTVNDYLAKRDSEQMGRIHRFLGLEVGVILAQLTPDERRAAYAADITYGTNNEFGFDYLRDNMAHSTDDMVQRGHNFAIVDEVDSDRRAVRAVGEIEAEVVAGAAGGFVGSAIYGMTDQVPGNNLSLALVLGLLMVVITMLGGLALGVLLVLAACASTPVTSGPRPKPADSAMAARRAPTPGAARCESSMSHTEPGLVTAPAATPTRKTRLAKYSPSWIWLVMPVTIRPSVFCR